VLAHLFDAMIPPTTATSGARPVLSQPGACIRSRSRRLAVGATTTCSTVSRMMFFGESAAPSRILPIGLIAVGIVWLALAE
jgi:hypothetical protein